jgi:predicted acetyltransferase
MIARIAPLRAGRTLGLTFDHGEDFFTALHQVCRRESIRYGYIPRFLAGFREVQIDCKGRRAGHTTSMPEFVAPAMNGQRSFLSAVAEYQQEGRYTDLDQLVLQQPAAFRAYLDALAVEALPETPRRPGIVAQTTLWWMDGGAFLGRLSLRHELTDALREVGGHIGYDVRPSARRRGHATSMLHAGLQVANAMGIDPALITCDENNVASRKVIERAGGELWRADGDKLRFWVPTGR